MLHDSRVYFKDARSDNIEKQQCPRQRVFFETAMQKNRIITGL